MKPAHSVTYNHLQGFLNNGAGVSNNGALGNWNRAHPRSSEESNHWINSAHGSGYPFDLYMYRTVRTINAVIRLLFSTLDVHGSSYLVHHCTMGTF